MKAPVALLAGLAVCVLAPAPSLAVQPGEMLADARLESRARAISEELRCLVCQNQSIDDSDAPLAHDLRVLVRDRLKAGDDDGAVRRFIVSRYGEYVLLKPVVAPHTMVLWLAPSAILLAGLVGLVMARRHREPRRVRLSDEERRRVDALLRDEGERQATLASSDKPSS